MLGSLDKNCFPLRISSVNVTKFAPQSPAVKDRTPKVPKNAGASKTSCNLYIRHFYIITLLLGSLEFREYTTFVLN